MELTPEQIKAQEIEALTGMPWWWYLVEDFKSSINDYEEIVHSLDIADTPEYSKRAIFIVYVNVLRAMIEKPHRLLWELKTLK